jgi:hypothetical protein
MLTKAKIAVAAAIVASAGSMSLAKDGGLPAIDVQRLCRADMDALRTAFGNDTLQTMDSCVADEQAAREELVKNWASYPALAKAKCVRPQEYLPGYVEWQVCIEMTRDVLELRKQPTGDTTVGSARQSPAISSSP